MDDKPSPIVPTREDLHAQDLGILGAAGLPPCARARRHGRKAQVHPMEYLMPASPHPVRTERLVAGRGTIRPPLL